MSDSGMHNTKPVFTAEADGADHGTDKYEGCTGGAHNGDPVGGSYDKARSKVTGPGADATESADYGKSKVTGGE